MCSKGRPACGWRCHGLHCGAPTLFLGVCIPWFRYEMYWRMASNSDIQNCEPVRTNMFPTENVWNDKQGAYPRKYSIFSEEHCAGMMSNSREQTHMVPAWGDTSGGYSASLGRHKHRVRQAKPFSGAERLIWTRRLEEMVRSLPARGRGPWWVRSPEYAESRSWESSFLVDPVFLTGPRAQDKLCDILVIPSRES